MTQAVPQPIGAIPYLTLKGAADAIGFYQRVLGAELVVKLADPSGRVVHAQLTVGGATFMMTEEMPQFQALSPATIGGSGTAVTVYVPDADATIAKALAAGAQPNMPLMDQFWGDRAGGIVDPFGHKWIIATRKEEVGPEELVRRFQKLIEQGGSNCG